MVIIGRINKKDNASYIINSQGEIIETETLTREISKINRKPDHEYRIDYDGNIHENEIVYLTMKDFYEKKRNGDLAKLYHEGKIVKIKDNESTLKVLEEIRIENLKSILINAKIVNVKGGRDKEGNFKLQLDLDNNHSLILREGVGVSSIELE